MSCTNELSRKSPDAKVIITFDFSTALEPGETLTSFVSRDIAVIAGVDPDPTLMWNGPQVLGIGSTYVQQPVQGGLDGCYYQLEMIYDTNVPGRRLVVTAVLPVFSAS